MLSLSDRELEIMSLIAEGKTYKEIALELHLGQSTVRTHIHNVLTKLDLPTQTTAVLGLVKLGYINPRTIMKDWEPPQ
jgi:two-component system NarL family response regulator